MLYYIWSNTAHAIGVPHWIVRRHTRTRVAIRPHAHAEWLRWGMRKILTVSVRYLYDICTISSRKSYAIFRTIVRYRVRYRTVSSTVSGTISRVVSYYIAVGLYDIGLNIGTLS